MTKKISSIKIILIIIVTLTMTIVTTNTKPVHAMDDESLIEMIAGKTYAANGFTVEFWNHGKTGFVDVVTHGDKKLINTISYEVYNGVVLLEGDLAYYYNNTGVIVDRIYHMFVVSHDGRLYPVVRDQLVFEKKR